MAVDASRVKSLFLAASDLVDPAKRAAYLERECGGDAELRQRVEALLRANDAAPLPAVEDQNRTSAFTPNDANQIEDYGDPSACVGTLLAGKYNLIEEIGEGGMGSVFMAQQIEPVKRVVAVKVIKAGMDSRAVLARFEAERQALAMMDHPNIAKVLDGGTTEGGRPFFVMELVKGTPITRYCDDHKLTPRQRLELFVPVCQAIQHAHQKGIIHRDIKPSNVLVAMYDDKPVPKVIDFGVAKAAGQTLTDKTLMTGFGALVGTPEYMSPEQASLNNLDIDTRSDVYSLGVLLYELLTGTTPVDRKALGKAALLEILRIVREVEAPRPSAKLSSDTLPSVAANRGTEPTRLSKLMRGELDWLVLKALEKDRARRYETANALARDIQRYLADEVVEARPPSMAYRVSKFVRRHKGQVIAASLVLLALVGGIVGTSMGLVQADHERAKAESLANTNEKLADEESKARNAAEYQLGVSNMVLAAAAYDNRDVILAAERLEKVPKEQRGWEWHYLKRQVRGGVYTLEPIQNGTLRVSFSPDGERIITGSGPRGGGRGEVKVWDARTGTPLFVLVGVAKGSAGMQKTLFSLGGKRLAAATPGDTATVWDAESGKLQVQLKHTGQAAHVALSPDGTRITTVDGTVKVWDAQTGALQLELKNAGEVTLVSFSPDGSRIVTGGQGQTVKVWDAQKGTELLSLAGYKGRAGSVSFSPDGTRIAVLAAGAMVWDAKTGTPLYKLPEQAPVLCSASFSPDAMRIVTGNHDGTAKVWDAKIGTLLFELKGRTRPSLSKHHFSFQRLGEQSVSFSPDGTRIVTVGGPLGAHEATVWDARTGTELLALTGHTDLVLCAAFSPDGTRIVTGSADGTAKVWDARTGTPRLEMNGNKVDVFFMALSADGTRMVTGGGDYNKPGEVKVWDAPTGTALFDLKGFKDTVWSVAINSDGTRIATAGGVSDEPGRVIVWHGGTGAALLEIKEFREGVNSVAISPDGTRVVTAGSMYQERAALEGHSGGTELKVWDGRTGALQLDLTRSIEKNGFVHSDWRGGRVAFAPDGTRFVAAGLVTRRPDGTRNTKGIEVGDTGGVNEATVYDAQTGTALLELKGHQGVVQCVAFSRDGKYIVTGGGDEDHTAKVWDARTGKPLRFELKGHTGAVLSVEFSPDGTRIVTGSADKTVRVWDARTGTTLLELKGFKERVDSIAFSPDGTRIVTGELGGTIALWDARPGKGAPDDEELAYRRLHMQPNVWRYRENHLEARAAKDDFAARFYLDRLIEHFTSENKPDEVKKWRAERAKYPAVAPPSREKK